MLGLCIIAFVIMVGLFGLVYLAHKLVRWDDHDNYNFTS
jgi:uncharacterized iron-regulated membrane protein